MWVSLVLVVVAPVLDTAGIGLFKVLVDRVVVPHDFHLFPPLALVYLTLAVLQGVVSFTDHYLSTWIGERFVLGLRRRLFGHLHRLSLGFFESRPLGDLLSRLTGDTGAIENLVLSGIDRGLTYGLKLVLFTGAMFYLDWRLAAASLVAAPGFLLVARVFSGRIKRASREKRRRVAAITSVAEESFSNAALVRAYDRGAGEDARFDEQNLAMFSAQMAATRLQALFGPLTDLLEVIGVLLVVALAVRELADGRLTIGGLLVFMAYLTRLYSPIQGLSQLTNSLSAASASAERVVEILDQTPSITEAGAPRRLDRARGAVRLRGVCFAYPGAEDAVLRGIEADIAPGQTIAVVGGSGTGKSTLAKLLLRFYDPDSGSITLDGIDLRELSLGDLYRNVATVLQETLVFDGTVRENILWGRPEASEQEIIDAAITADAHEFIQTLPHGYDTRIGQRGRKLSGGQRQRLAIARAVIRDAPVLLLDEPTTGLDAESTRRVLAPLRRVMHGRTTIIISHNLLTVADADAILYLERGRVAAAGTHTQLLASCRGYQHLYRLHRQPGPHGDREPRAARPRSSPRLRPPRGSRMVPGPAATRCADPAHDAIGAEFHIQFAGVRYRYPGHHLDALPEVSFSVPHGGCLAVVGPHGSGKSTLLQLLLRHLDPTGGTIRYNGIHLYQLDPRWLCTRIALIPAETQQAPSLTALDIPVGTTPPQRHPSRPEHNLPTSTLERRRGEINRALRNNPEVLLFDDPTEGLDSHDRNELLATLCLLPARHTMLIATQDPAVSALADQLVQLPAPNPCREPRRAVAALFGGHRLP
jgi:ATP-binding cassette subfamily B protein